MSIGEDMAWPKNHHIFAVTKRHHLTFLHTFPPSYLPTYQTTYLKEYPQGAALKTCDFWDIWSEWWGEEGVSTFSLAFWKNLVCGGRGGGRQTHYRIFLCLGFLKPSLSANTFITGIILGWNWLGLPPLHTTPARDFAASNPGEIRVAKCHRYISV